MITIVGTGLSGLIGSRFRQLYGQDYEFENMDLTTGVDITDQEAVNEAVRHSKAEVILHLAAYTNVSAAHEQEEDEGGACYRVNVTGTKNVVQAAREFEKHLIHVSTDFVFDGSKDEPYTEADEPRPIEWYGKTKHMAEQAVEAGLDRYTILRLAYPYQAAPSRPDFLANIRRKLTDGSLPPQFSDHIVTPTFVDDLAQVFDFCARHKPHGIFHATGSSWHSDYEIAGMVKRAFALPGEVKTGTVDESLRNGNRPYQKVLKMSNRKLSGLSGIRFKDFDAGLDEVMNQLKAERLPGTMIRGRMGSDDLEH
jgi:dTDP-4-dehydrorhamnose reductase